MNFAIFPKKCAVILALFDRDFRTALPTSTSFLSPLVRQLSCIILTHLCQDIFGHNLMPIFSVCRKLLHFFNMHHIMKKIKFLSDTGILKQCIFTAFYLYIYVTPDVEILDTKGVISVPAHTCIQSYNQRQLDSSTKNY